MSKIQENEQLPWLNQLARAVVPWWTVHFEKVYVKEDPRYFISEVGGFWNLSILVYFEDPECKILT